MTSPFSQQSFLKACTRFALGVITAQCGFCGVLQVDAWAQGQVGGAPGNQALQTATEAQVKELWSKLQANSIELEATDPRAAITRYQEFFEQGAGRFPSVGVQVGLRIARIWQIDLKDYDKAIEIYDWALELYRSQPEAVQLQQGRLAAEQAQDKAEAAQAPKVPGAPSLGVPVPRSTIGGQLGVSLPFLGSAKLPSFTVPQSVSRGNALGWQPGTQRCVTALAQQQNGVIWVATEDSGVWRYNPSGIRAQDKWQQFTAKDGLGDDSAFALAVDKQGRVWAGTLRHGVSVWNGQVWNSYGVQDGPLGERVYDIAVCPTDGDVWMATNAGLTRYSPNQDKWSAITGEGGLSNQVQALAFNQSGDLLVGTQCDGVALAQAADGYKAWRVVKGPEQSPTTPTGQGLPSSLINAVLVSKDGTFYVGTTMGLAWSRNAGKSWSYVRGQDYAAKVRGLVGGAPRTWVERSGAVLAEDYVSCLAQDEAGRLWVGHWRAGDETLEMQEGQSGGVKRVVRRESSGFVKAILPLSNALPLVARYDEGMSNSLLPGAKTNAPKQQEKPVATPPQQLQVQTEKPVSQQLQVHLP